MKKKLSRSIRKYIREQKARIRRDFFGVGEQERLIRELYERFLPKIKKEKIDKTTSEEEGSRAKKSPKIVKKSASHQSEKKALSTSPSAVSSGPNRSGQDGTKKKQKTTSRIPKKSKSVSPGQSTKPAKKKRI